MSPAEPSMIDELTRLLPPPDIHVTPPPWERSFDEIGVSFPTDYRQFIDRYGVGGLSSAGTALTLGVVGPAGGALQTGPEQGFASYLEEHAEYFPGYGGDVVDGGHWSGYVRPVFPEPGGLLVWGCTDNGDTLVWDTRPADPDRWPIVMLPRHARVPSFFDGGMVAFLVALLRGEHPESAYLVSTGARWTILADWVSENLNSTAGPAADD